MSRKSAATRAIHLIALGAALVQSSGCRLYTDPETTGIEPLRSQPGITVAGDAKLTAVHAVMGKYCYQCHQQYKRIGIDANLTALYIAPGNPGKSKLYAALLGSGVTDRSLTPFVQTMPLGLTPPFASEVEIVRQWIASLAPASGSGNGPEPTPLAPAPVLVQVSPPSPSRSSTAPVVTGLLQTSAATLFPLPMTTVTLFRDDACTQVIRSGTVAQFASPGLQAAVPANKASPIFAQSSTADGKVVSECVLITTYVHDTVAPAAPQLVSTAPAAPSAAQATAVTNPMVKGQAPADADKVQLFASSNCSGMVAATGSRDAFVAGGITIGVQAMGTTVLSANALDAAGNASACSSATLTYVTASAAPANPVATAIEPKATVAAPSNERRPILSGTAPATGAAVSTSVRLYRDPACSAAQEIGSTTSIAASTRAWSIELSADLDSGAVDKDLEIYGRAFAGAASSACVKLTGSAAVPSYRLDTLAPPAPTAMSLDPLPPFATTAPRATGTVPTSDAAGVQIYLGDDCRTLNAGGPLADFSASGAGLALALANVPRNSTVALSATVTDKAGNRSACGAGLARFVFNPDTATRLSGVTAILQGPSCVGCHGASAGPLSLVRSTDAEWQEARSAGGLRLVVPNKPEESLLFQRLAGNGIGGAQATMPMGGVPLSPQDINAIRYWIVNMAAAPPPPPAAPTGTLAFNPASPSPNRSPRLTLSPGSIAADAGFVELYTSSTCAGTPIASGDRATLIGAGVTIQAAANARTDLYAKAYNDSGKARFSGCSALLGSYVHDDIGPGAPAVLSSLPSSSAAMPSLELTPVFKGTVAAGTGAVAIQLFGSTGCAGLPQATGTVAAFTAGAGIPLGVASMATTYVSAKAVDAAGNLSTCSQAALPYFNGSAAPAAPTMSSVIPAATVESPSNNRRPVITGKAPDNGAIVTTGVRIYRDALCLPAQEIGSTNAIDATTRAFTVAVGTDLDTGEVDRDIEIYARAFSDAGNGSACVKITGTGTVPAYRLDTRPPNAPVLSAASTVPLPPFATTSPRVVGTIKSSVGDASAVLLYLSATCSGTAVGNGPVAAFIGSGGIALNLASVSANSNVTVSAQTVDKAGNLSACSIETVSFRFNPDAANRLAMANAVVQAQCLSCHGAAGPYRSLVFATDAAWQAAKATTGQPLVVPGNLASSFLYQKINHADGTAAGNMPLGGSLARLDSSALRFWILNMASVAIPAPAAPSGTLAFAPASPSGVAAPTVSLPPANLAADAGFIEFFGNSACTGAVLGSGTRAAVVAAPGVSLAMPANARTDIHARAYDGPGKERASGCSPLLGSYVHDSVAPAAPVVASSMPSSSGALPSLELNPRIRGTAPADAASIQLFAAAGCSGNVAATGSAADFTTGQGIALAVAANATTQVSAKAVDAAGNASSCSIAALAYVNGSAAPAAPVLTSIAPAATAASPSNNRRPTLSGTAPANGATLSTSVKLYRDAACSATQEIGSTSAINATTRAFSIALSADLESGAIDRDVDVYGRAFSSAAANNMSACVKLTGTASVAAYRLDTAAPAAPTLSQTVPAAPFATSVPKAVGATASADSSQVQLFLSASCAGAANASGTAAAFADAAQGIALNLASVAANAQVSVSAIAVDKAGNLSACSSAPLSFQFNPDAAARLARANAIVRGSSCMACHGAGAGTLSLVKDTDADWQSSKSYANASASLVAPGKPESSVLFQRLAGNGLTGFNNNMPMGGAALAAADLAALRYWIANMTAQAPVATPAIRLAKANAIFQGPACVACHGNGGFATNLVKATDADWTAAKTAGGAALVVAGKPDSSPLFQRLAGNGLSGYNNNMPMGGAALAAADLASIREWIAGMSAAGGSAKAVLASSPVTAADSCGNAGVAGIASLTRLQHLTAAWDLLAAPLGAARANAVFAATPAEDLEIQSTLARALAEAVTAGPADLSAFVRHYSIQHPACGTDEAPTISNAACVDAFISGLGLHVLRRPLDAEPTGSREPASGTALPPTDVAHFRAVHDRSTGGGYRGLINSLLGAPGFMLQGEFRDGEAPAFELAARLSFYVTGTMPDDALIGAAFAGFQGAGNALGEHAARLLGSLGAAGPARTTPLLARAQELAPLAADDCALESLRKAVAAKASDSVIRGIVSNLPASREVRKQ